MLSAHKNIAVFEAIGCQKLLVLILRTTAGVFFFVFYFSRFFFVPPKRKVFSSSLHYRIRINLFSSKSRSQVEEFKYLSYKNKREKKNISSETMSESTTACFFAKVFYSLTKVCGHLLAI